MLEEDSRRDPNDQKFFPVCKRRRNVYKALFWSVGIQKIGQLLLF